MAGTGHLSAFNGCKCAIYVQGQQHGYDSMHGRKWPLPYSEWAVGDCVQLAWCGMQTASFTDSVRSAAMWTSADSL